MTKQIFKSKALYLSLVAIAFLFITGAPVVKAEGCDTYITLSKQTICVNKLIHQDGSTYSYYSVYLPTKSLPNGLQMTLGVQDRGVMNTAQIQARAKLFWGSLTFPLPY